MPVDFEKILEAIEESKKGHPAAEEELEKAKRAQSNAARVTEKQIEAYNEAWLEALFEYMIENGLGWCGAASYGHCCKEEDLRGYAHWGTHWVGSEYYERKESFFHTGVKCNNCNSRSDASRGHKTLPFEVRSVWEKEIQAYLYWWRDAPSPIQKLAEEAGLPNRIKKTASRGITTYTLNGEVILEFR